jgi:hypothetical protein
MILMPYHCWRYLPNDSDEDIPIEEVRDIINHCNSRGRQLTACDAKAHHILWGSTDINPRQ